MGGIDEGAAARELLRQCAARCDGGRLAGFVWRLLWHDWWAGLCIARRRRQLVGDCSRSSCGTFSGGPDIVRKGVMSTAMIRVAMPLHLQTLAGVSGDVTVKVDGDVT